MDAKAFLFILFICGLTGSTTSLAESNNLSQKAITAMACESFLQRNTDNVDAATGLHYASPADQRGMSPRHDRIFQNYSNTHNLIIIVRDSNRAATEYVHLSQSEYTSKSRALKNCKSAQSGPNKGLVICPPEMFASIEAWRSEIIYLQSQGFTVSGPEESYLVRDAEGRAVFSDIDLQGVYDAFTGKPKYVTSIREELNNDFGRKLVRHGPLDDYAKRFEVGIKLPLTVYRPRLPSVQVTTLREMRHLYNFYGINFEAIWGSYGLIH